REAAARPLHQLRPHLVGRRGDRRLTHATLNGMRVYGHDHDDPEQGPLPDREYVQLYGGPLDGQLHDVTGMTVADQRDGALLITEQGAHGPGGRADYAPGEQAGRWRWTGRPPATTTCPPAADPDSAEAPADTHGRGLRRVRATGASRPGSRAGPRKAGRAGAASRTGSTGSCR